MTQETPRKRVSLTTEERAEFKLLVTDALRRSDPYPFGGSAATLSLEDAIATGAVCSLQEVITEASKPPTDVVD